MSPNLYRKCSSLETIKTTSQAQGIPIPEALTNSIQAAALGSAHKSLGSALFLVPELFFLPSYSTVLKKFKKPIAIHPFMCTVGHLTCSTDVRSFSIFRTIWKCI